MKSKYGFIGLLIGGILGAMVGAGNTYYTKKSQKAEELKVQMPIWAAVGAITCMIIGASLGAKVEEEEKGKKTKATQQKHEQEKIDALGLNNRTSKLIKDGRFWVGLTVWKNPTTNKEYRLLTTRTTSKYIASALNDEIIINHLVKGADKQNIENLHTIALQKVYDVIKEHGEWQGGTMGSVAYRSNQY